MQKPVSRAMFILLYTLLYLTASCSSNEEESRMKDLLNNKCTVCHDLDSTRSQNLSESEWREVIDEMIDLGTYLEDEEKESLVKYLSEEYGV